MSANPLVSIITPTYNSEKFISHTLESIINQVYKNWELLITDDNSSDNTVVVIQKYVNKDDRIKLFKLSKNQGAGYARNNSLKKIKGRFIAFCDSDDLWHKNKLNIQVKFMLDNNINLTYSNYDQVDENGGYIRSIKSPKFLNFKKMLRNDYIGFSTLIYDYNYVGKVFLSNMRKRQDYLFKLNLFKKVNTSYGINKTLVYYRLRSNSISRNKFKLIKFNFLVYKKLNFSNSYAFYRLVIFLFFYFEKKIKQL